MEQDNFPSARELDELPVALPDDEPATTEPSNTGKLDEIREGVLQLREYLDEISIRIDDLSRLTGSISRPRMTHAEHARWLADHAEARNDHFGTGLFRDPAWEILLDLYRRENDRRTVTLTEALTVAEVPEAIAMQAFRELEHRGFVRRTRSRGGSARIVLCEAGRSAMHRYLEASARSLGLKLGAAVDRTETRSPCWLAAPA